MTETQTEIRDAIDTHPGIHFNELVRRLELAPGQVQYHLKKLTSADSVIDERLYGRTHYYAPEYCEWERQALALLRRETAADVVAHVLANEPVRPAEVAEDLDIARGTLEWHLDRLVDHGLVAKHHDERNHVTLTVEDWTGTVEILMEADPSLIDRFVDRFVRLTDRLLSE